MKRSSCWIWTLFYLALPLVIFLPINLGSELNSVLSDSVLYRITWPGPFTVHPQKKDRDTIVMSTRNNEKYVCTLPDAQQTYAKPENMAKYGSPRLLIHSLWKTCSYRIESYWTYEICHGQHLRQYHERMEAGKSIQSQEYILGKYTTTVEQDTELNTFETREEFRKRTVKVENVDLAYVHINMTEGTICDITGKPRSARLLYVCHEAGRGEILEIKETSTCNYDVIIMTKLLCGHPAFRADVSLSNNIECFAMENAQRKPVDLDRQLLEDAALDAGKASPIVFKPKTEDEDQKQKETPKPVVSDIMIGKYCFIGGRGWWQHEFCLNKLVKQFHVDKKTGSVQEILLGTWNHQNHLQWIKKNRQKRHHKHLKYIYLYYGSGDYCDLIKDYRSVTVKLKCSNIGSKPFYTTVTEPSPCHYEMVVESELLCPVFDHINDQGLPVYNPR